MKNQKLRMLIFILISLAIFLVACIPNAKEKPSLWSSFDWEKVGGFTMEGNNMSPLKEIAADCNTVTVRIDDFKSPEPVIFHIQLIYDDTHIIAEKLVLPAAAEGENIELAGNIKKGDQIRVFTQVFKEDGTYNPDLTCELSYSYMLK